MAQHSGRSISDPGEVVRFSCTGIPQAPGHCVNYSATDMRHEREASLAPWRHVGLADGSVSPTDFDQPVKAFPDGPGAWRQT